MEFLGGIKPKELQTYSDVQNQFNNIYQQLSSFGRIVNSNGLSDEIIKYAQSTDQATASVEAFYQTQLKSTNGLFGTIQAMKTYNNISSSDVETRKAFALAISKTNESLGDQMVKLNGSSISMKSYAKCTISAAAESMKFRAAETLLNLGLNTLVSVGIAAVINGLNAYINAGQKAVESANEQAETLKQQQDEVVEYNQKIIELRKSLDDGNLSEEETVSTRKKLIELQGGLNSFYGDEINNVDTLKSSYDELNKAQGKYVSNSADKWLSDNAKVLDEAEIAYEHFGDLDYFDHLASDIQKLKQGNLTVDEFNSLVDKYGSELSSYNKVIKKWNGERADTINEVTAQSNNLAQDLQKLVYDKAMNPTYLQKVTNKLDESQRRTLGFNYSQSNELLQVYATYGEMLSKSNSKYHDLLTQIEEQNSELTDAISTEDSAAASVAKTKLEQLRDLVNDYNIVQDEAAKLFLNNLIKDSLSKANDLSDNTDFINDWVKTINEAFNEKYGLYSGNRQNIFAEIIPKLNNAELETLLKIIQGEIDVKIDWLNIDPKEAEEKISRATNAISFNWTDFFSIRTVDDTSKTLKDIIDDQINPLKSAYKTLAEGGTLGDDFFNQFPDLLQYANDADALKQHMQELINSLTESSLKELLAMYNSTDDEAIKGVLKQAIELLRVDRDITSEVEDTDSAYEKEAALIRENIRRQSEIIKQINEEIEKQKEKREQLEEQKELLEEQATQYESAANAVTRQIDKQIEALEKQKSLVEDYYDKQIDALKEEAEERDRINDLREKELALEKAKNTKVRVYSSSRGFTIQRDSEEISSKQKEYDDAVRNYQIEDLEKEKEAALANYDAQIEAWNNYKDSWQEAIDAWKNGQDEMNAAAVFGADWREKVARKDLEMVSQYKTEYGTIQDQIKDITENQLVEIDKEIERLEKKLDVYENLKKDQQEYLDFYKTYSSEFAKATDEQTAALKNFLEVLKSGKDVQGFMDMFEEYEKLRALFDEDYDSNEGHGLYTDKDKENAAYEPSNKTNSSAQTKLNNFLNSKLMRSIPTSVNSAFAKTNAVFNGLPTKDYNYAQTKVNNNSGVTYNQRTWNMNGSVIVDSYDKFKEYFDRYVREAKQDLVVGR